MSDKQARELRRRRRRYEWEARHYRFTNAWERVARAVFFRSPPRLRTRVRPSVVVAASMLVGLVVGTTYWVLIALGLTPVVLGLAVTLIILFWAAVGGLFLRFWRVESRQAPLRPSSGSGFSGVREPRRPSPNPQATAVELPEPTHKEE